jgi:hypothetical protein
VTVREALRRVFAPIAPDWWIYPTVVVAGTALPGIFGAYEEPVWALHTLLVVCVLALLCGVPMNLTYRHAWDRVVGPSAPPLAPRVLAFHAVVIAGWIFVGGELTHQLLMTLGSPFPFEEAAPQGVLLGFTLVAAAVAVASTLDAYRGRIRELETRELRAHLDAIQARVHPHFLFNCLNTVAGLIREDPVLAERAVERLADLFRYTLASSRRRFVPLAEELEAVRGFLELEAVRFGERVKATLHVAADVGEAEVPPLVLQPVVENAIRHGIAPRREGGRLEVRIERVGERLRLEVEDDGPGPGGSSHRGTGTALDDLRSRLSLLYGLAARVEAGRGPLGGYRIRIELPARRAGRGEEAT